MNLFVLLKMVPDTVEELSVTDNGKSLDSEYLRYKLSDPDEHALEQALLLKENHGGNVTVIAIDSPELDDALYTALAKGADRAVKLAGEFGGIQSLPTAQVLSAFLRAGGEGVPRDALILLRGQAIDDLDGEVGPYLAELLEAPYACVVTGAEPVEAGVAVTKEFSGGLRGTFELPLPAVLGIQSAEKPPRYVPFAKVRAAMKSGEIETVEVATPESPPRLEIDRMYPPEVTGRAEMLEGSPEEVSERILEVLTQQSLI